MTKRKSKKITLDDLKKRYPVFTSSPPKALMIGIHDQICADLSCTQDELTQAFTEYCSQDGYDRFAKTRYCLNGQPYARKKPSQPKSWQACLNKFGKPFVRKPNPELFCAVAVWHLQKSLNAEQRQLYQLIPELLLPQVHEFIAEQKKRREAFALKEQKKKQAPVIKRQTRKFSSENERFNKKTISLRKSA